MRNLMIVLLIVYAVMRCIETFWPRRKVPGHIQILYSLPLIVVTYVCLFLVVFWEMKDWVADLLFIAIAALGWLLIAASIVGRNWAIRSLGEYHSIHIELREQHILIQNGPYRYVRNPYYLSNGIEAIGLVLIANGRAALVIVLCVYFPLLIHRLVCEEAALSQRLGSLYESYQRQVPMLFPKLLRPLKARFAMLKWKETSAGSTN